MPDRAEMADVILELNRIATDTGIRFESIDAVARDRRARATRCCRSRSSFEGNFYNLSDFLFRLRNLVAVRDGELNASGRLFNVQSISFGSGDGLLPAARRQRDGQRLRLRLRRPPRPTAPAAAAVLRRLPRATRAAPEAPPADAPTATRARRSAVS